MRRIVLALLVAGCASQPTTEDMIGTSYAAIEAAADIAAELCAAPAPGADCTGRLSTADRDDIRALLTDAADLVDDAQALHSVGADDQAMQAVRTARKILARIETRLPHES